MYKHETTVRVLYAHTDKMGVVYYGRYTEYLEWARTELIRSLGISYRSIEEVLGIGLPVLHAEIKYIRPAHYDDVITIHTKIPEFPRGRITFASEMYKGTTLINVASITLCFVSLTTGRPVKCPDIIAEKLNEHFEQERE